MTRCSTARCSLHSTHAGWADTPGVGSSLPRFHRLTGPLLRSPQQGADTIVWLGAAAEPGESSGGFWHDRRRRPTHRVPWTSETLEDREWLWRECERLTGRGMGRAWTRARGTDTIGVLLVDRSRRIPARERGGIDHEKTMRLTAALFEIHDADVLAAETLRGAGEGVENCLLPHSRDWARAPRGGFQQHGGRARGLPRDGRAGRSCPGRLPVGCSWR